MKYKRFIDVAGGWAKFQMLLHVLHTVARQHNTSISTVAVRCMLDEPAVAAVMVGTRLTSAETIDENKAALNLSLSASDRDAIRAAQAHLNPIPGDCGDEYRKPPFLTASGDLSHHVNNFPKPYPVKRDDQGVEHALSGTVWEDLAGFSRAVRKGNRILISGTTATHGDRVIGGADPAAQMQFVLDKIEGALQSLGARVEDVMRTRIFIRNIGDWEAVARAHGQRFAHIQPANTMVRADLIGDEYLVEMEAEAEVAG
jgi:enamine deaminase RidA (YjgF/YER057c/UK114 family)